MTKHRPDTRRLHWRAAFAAIAASALLALAVTWFAFPGLVMKAMTAAERRSAGLERHEAVIGGDRIAYLDGGSGTPVLLIHGFGASKDLWNRVAGRLTPRYRVIVPDVPGFGESTVRADARYDASTQARRLHALVAALGIREHHVGGVSMGGLIATVYASQYPRDVLSLTILDAPGVRAPRESDAVRLLAASENPFLVRDDADFGRLLALTFHHPPSMPAAFRRVVQADLVARRDSFARIFADLDMLGAGAGQLEPLLPALGRPTLILWGQHDRMIDVSAAGVFSTGIRGSQATIFPDCGHTLPRECPELVATRYLEFLGSLPGAGLAR